MIKGICSFFGLQNIIIVTIAPVFDGGVIRSPFIKWEEAEP
jgi:hypothetical protein